MNRVARCPCPSHMVNSYHVVYVNISETKFCNTHKTLKNSLQRKLAKQALPSKNGT